MEEVGRTLGFPTREDVVNLNRRHIQESGGLFSGRDNLRSPGSLEWVLEAIQCPLSDVDLYPTLVEKAATLAWVIISGHVFNDGCKRTGMSLLETLLESHGYELKATDDEVIEVALRIAKGQAEQSFSREDFVQWVRDKLGLSVA